MTAARILFTAMALILALAACQKKNVASVASLPVLERPLLTLAGQTKESVALSIPFQALSERAGISGVYVLRNREARFRMVRIGKASATQVQVLSGLHGDETLVLGDLSAVHDGSPIKILAAGDKRK